MDPESAPLPTPPDGPTMPMDIQELADFMAAFNESTARLRESHERLRGRVDELAGELSVKNAELTARIAEVSALKNYLANILESITDGVLALSRDGEVVALNGVAAALLPAAGPRAEAPAPGAGLDAAALEGLTGAARVIDLQAALRGPAAAVARLMLAASETGAPVVNHEVWLEAEGASRRCLTVSAGPIRDADDVTLGAVATFRDNTEIRRLEETLRRRERLAALGEMAAQLAHEIRNPLGGIELYASLLERALANAADEQKLAQKIRSATRSLNGLVEDMLTFTRPLEPRRGSVRVGHTLSAALELLSGRLAEAGVAVERVDTPDDTVALDPDLIERVWMNVVLNAVQVMEEKDGGGRLFIETGRGAGATGPVFRVCVGDTGPGVPEDLREQIFNPFFTRREGGTGLGLAIVQKIVQAHGGTVVVRERPPRGAEFVFEFPLREEPNSE